MAWLPPVRDIILAPLRVTAQREDSLRNSIGSEHARSQVETQFARLTFIYSARGGSFLPREVNGVVAQQETRLQHLQNDYRIF
jgi:hypothetical protein